jgi:hypothetical protein
MVAAANLSERVVAAAAGLALFYADAWADVAGLALAAVAVGAHLVRIKGWVPVARDTDD